MRIANVGGRAKLLVGDSASVIDVASLSDERFGPSLQALYDDWPAFRDWAAILPSLDDHPEGGTEHFDPVSAGPPSPEPKQVSALALNYVDHAAESGTRPPDEPLVFAKYVSAFSGPIGQVVLPAGNVDWECELVAVISKTAHGVDASQGWDYVAGLTVGQDISERILQRSGPVPQFGLAKSHPGFAPMGPVLVTPDEFDDPDDLAIGCAVNDQQMQGARTSDMIFPVPALVSYLSRVVTLLPGDVIFTGTPPGVGMGRNPQVFLQPGDHLRSYVEGIGEMHQRFIGA